MKNNLLLDEYPLVILPSLAVEFGLNESIILQQLHYWIERSNNEKDGCKWVYNTYADWKEQFPFWSDSTIKRTIKKLENQNVVITAKYNKMAIDNTKWYTINYEKLRMNRPPGQNDQTSGSNWTDGQVKMTKPITRDYTETTTETNLKDYIIEIVNHLNSVTGSKYKPSTKSTKTLIKGWLNKGFEVDDFKKVIEVKTDEWKNSEMEKYLRPITLFGNKFESYLNQKPVKANSNIPKSVEKAKQSKGQKYPPDVVKAIQEMREQGHGMATIKEVLNIG